MAYLKNGYHKNGGTAVGGVWGDTKDFVGNIAGTIGNVRTITGKLASEGKIKTEVQLPPYIKYLMFGSLALTAYWIFFRKH